MHDGLQLDGRILFCDSIRGLGLVEVSWETIEHVAAIRCRLDQRLSKYLKYQIVRYQVAPTNILDCLSSYFGICRNFPAQQLSARKVRDPIVLGKLGRLRSLARTGRGNQQQTHRSYLSGGLASLRRPPLRVSHTEPDAACGDRAESGETELLQHTQLVGRAPAI